MISELQTDTIVEKMGGRFRLCALVQRRLVQLMEGARPLVERAGRSDLAVAIDEVAQGKIDIGYESDNPDSPEKVGADSAGPAGA
jgi:DNA-directed RNA polymerase subunit omega